MKPTPEILPFAAADERLGGALSASFQGGYERVLLFDGDLVLEGDFLEALPEEDAELIAVSGDLTVSGRIALYEYTPALYVGGVTRALTLEGGDAEVYVQDGEFAHFVYGYYNDGTLETGQVSTPWVINSDHDLRVSAPGAYLVDNYGDDGDADFTRENITESFVPEVVDAEYGQLDMRAFRQRLQAGLPVLRPGAQTIVEAALTEVTALRAARATQVDLTGRKLKEFPVEILEMPWLEALILDDNPIGSLPAAIHRLQNLKQLSVSGCRLTDLPATLGDLAQLQVLRVAGNELTALPEAIGRLSRLVELDISSLSARPDDAVGALPEITAFPLPDSAAELRSLRKLTADHTRVIFPAAMHGLPSLEEISMQGSSYLYLRTFPEAVTTFPNLRHLDLSRNFFGEIPASLLRLSKLETLGLGNALGLVRSPLPDLSQLPRLATLDLSGNTDHTGVPVPAHDLLRPLFAMSLPELRNLDIDRWGDSRKGERPAMTADVIAGIGRFTGLRRVDLSFNGLTSLPEDFYELPELAELDLRYNALDRAARQRVAAAYPRARIDFRDQRGPDSDAELAEAQAASILVKDANILRDRRDWAGALAAYDRAIAHYREGSADSAYGLLYAHYGKMWIHGKLGYDASVEASAAARHRQDGVAEAEECLRLVPPVWQIFHFTDEGQFQREVVRYATNFLAWELSHASVAAEDHTRALELIGHGVACADGSEHVYLYDTQARVLLALGREADAWRVVHQALALDAEFEPLQDLRRDPRYLAWAR